VMNSSSLQRNGSNFCLELEKKNCSSSKKQGKNLKTKQHRKKRIS
jgi:hypothetical protein